MKRRRNPDSLYRKKPEVANVQSGELIDKVPDNGSNVDIAETANVFANQVNNYECEGYNRGNKSSKCNKCKYNCDTICSKYNDCDCCNFACASDKELLIRINCLLINKEYGLKAIEQKIRNSAENGDKKNIESITDLLERAIVGLGETALGAVKKAVDAAGTMTDITTGLAKIAAGAVGTAAVAGDIAAETAGLAAAGAATAGVAGDIAAESAGLAAAGAATVGVAGDIAAEAAGLAAAGAATAGTAADIIAEEAGAAAAITSTQASLADIVAGEAATAAAITGTQASLTDIVAGEAATAAAITSTKASLADVVAGEAATAAAITSTKASLADIVAGEAATAAAVSGTVAGAAQTAAGAAATSAAVSGTIASTAETINGAAATSAAVSGTVADAAQTAAGAAATSAAVSETGVGAVATGAVVTDTFTDTVQICVLNNNSKPTGIIDIIMYDLTVEPKTDFYKRSAAVPASSSVFFTITSAPAVYEVQIQGLTRDILAYAVALKRTESSLSSQTPVEARILCMYP